MSAPKAESKNKSGSPSSDPPCIIWHETFTVGNKDLDAEHRRLVEIINEIAVAERTGFMPDQSLLNTLKRTAVEHFNHENSIMRKIKDSAGSSQTNLPGFLKVMSAAVIDDHITDHELSSAKLEEIIVYNQSKADSAKSSFCHDLKIWFLDHAIKFDAHLKAVFQAMQ